MGAIKNILIFSAGAGLGAGAGFYAARKVLEKRMDEEVTEVRDFYAQSSEDDKKKIEELSNKIKELTKTESQSKTSSKKKKEEPVEEDKDKNEEIIQKMDYSEISTAKKKSSGSKKKKVDPEIFIIDAEDFKELNGYDKTTLTYFPDEDRFLDESNADYDDGFEEVGGAANLEQFDDGYLYIRNRFTQTDYEVIRELRSFKRYMAEEMGE